MIPRILLALAGITVAACTPEQTAKFFGAVERAEMAAFKAGQLYCAFRKAGGETMIVAAADAAGVPVIVIDKSREIVARACTAIDASAIPVAPPANASPATVPTVAAPIQP